MRRTCRKSSRRGATTVEFALTVPLLFLFAFASLEFGRMNMIRHTMENAVYEAARRGMVPQTTDDDIRAAAIALLRTVSTRDPKITILRNNGNLTVTAAVECDRQGWIVPTFFRHRVMTSTVTLSQDAAG